jgi:hypothetical protein
MRACLEPDDDLPALLVQQYSQRQYDDHYAKMMLSFNYSVGLTPAEIESRSLSICWICRKTTSPANNAAFVATTSTGLVRPSCRSPPFPSATCPGICTRTVLSLPNHRLQKSPLSP